MAETIAAKMAIPHCAAKAAAVPCVFAASKFAAWTENKPPYDRSHTEAYFVLRAGRRFHPERTNFA